MTPSRIPRPSPTPSRSYPFSCLVASHIRFAACIVPHRGSDPTRDHIVCWRLRRPETIKKPLTRCTAPCAQFFVSSSRLRRASPRPRRRTSSSAARSTIFVRNDIRICRRITELAITTARSSAARRSFSSTRPPWERPIRASRGSGSECHQSDPRFFLGPPGRRNAHRARPTAAARRRAPTKEARLPPGRRPGSRASPTRSDNAGDGLVRVAGRARHQAAPQARRRVVARRPHRRPARGVENSSRRRRSSHRTEASVGVSRRRRSRQLDIPSSARGAAAPATRIVC